jgi:predicted nucleic acid-binding protein
VKEYILDACALIAYRRDEPGANVIQDILMEARADKIKLSMHLLNLTEVYYGEYRKSGEIAAHAVIRDISELPITLIEDLNMEILKVAGRFKARNKMSLADAVVSAVATLSNATIITADGEFMPLSTSGEVSIQFFRDPIKK